MDVSQIKSYLLHLGLFDPWDDPWDNPWDYPLKLLCPGEGGYSFD